jgi:hypothetical protein
MPDLLSAFMWIILTLVAASIVIALIAVLTVFIEGTDTSSRDEDFYPDEEEEFYHLKK